MATGAGIGSGSQSPGSISRTIERNFEESQYTGEINLSGRKLENFPTCANGYDLIDTTAADLSKNRFSEIPEEVCEYVSMEKLNCYHNVIKCLPRAIVQLQSLVYLNLSRNQLSSLPPSINCLEELRVLLVSNNKLSSLPDEITELKNLTELDVSVNEISNLPNQVCRLSALRSLNLRRNLLLQLPFGLMQLKLRKLDISSNRIAHIPLDFHKMNTLEELYLDNNPLLTPPSSISTRGLVHIMKYLSNELHPGEKRIIQNEARLRNRIKRSLSLSTTSPEGPGHWWNMVGREKIKHMSTVDSGYCTTDGSEKSRWSSTEVSPISPDELGNIPSKTAGELHHCLAIKISSPSATAEAVSMPKVSASESKPTHQHLSSGSPADAISMELERQKAEYAARKKKAEELKVMLEVETAKKQTMPKEKERAKSITSILRGDIKTFVDQASNTSTPNGQTSTGQTPAPVQSPVGQIGHVSSSPAILTPSGPKPTSLTSAGLPSASGQSSAFNSSTGQSSAGNSSVGHSSSGNSTAGHSSSGNSSTGHSSAGPVPSGRTSHVLTGQMSLGQSSIVDPDKTPSQKSVCHSSTGNAHSGHSTTSKHDPLPGPPVTCSTSQKSSCTTTTSKHEPLIISSSTSQSSLLAEQSKFKKKLQNIYSSEKSNKKIDKIFYEKYKQKNGCQKKEVPVEPTQQETSIKVQKLNEKLQTKEPVLNGHVSGNEKNARSKNAEEGRKGTLDGNSTKSAVTKTSARPVVSTVRGSVASASSSNAVSSVKSASSNSLASASSASSSNKEAPISASSDKEAASSSASSNKEASISLASSSSGHKAEVASEKGATSTDASKLANGKLVTTETANEGEQTKELRRLIESKLKIKLPDDIGEALQDGVILCHLANHLRPRSIMCIHIPSPAAPKLSQAKCRRNVDNFLLACRRMGLEQSRICSTSVILERRGIAAITEMIKAMIESSSKPKPSTAT